MPDPAKSVGDIDDVLSSIRRLVAEQPGPARAEAKSRLRRRVATGRRGSSCPDAGAARHRCRWPGAGKPSGCRGGWRHGRLRGSGRNHAGGRRCRAEFCGNDAGPDGKHVGDRTGDAGARGARTSGAGVRGRHGGDPLYPIHRGKVPKRRSTACSPRPRRIRISPSTSRRRRPNGTATRPLRSRPRSRHPCRMTGPR